MRNGATTFLELLADCGVNYLFGNPGSTELPLMDALVSHRQINFILGLHEIPVMAMADGYAQATRSLGVVNLHISCGLGNAMGMLYNAHRSGTPLLVTAGQQDRRLMFGEPILWSDLVEVARPWTKLAIEVNRIHDLPLAISRAVKTALMPPTGPVFLSLPMDVQQEVVDFDVVRPQQLNPSIRPQWAELRRAAELLVNAEDPVILAGSGVLEANAVEPLKALAETLGAKVVSESGGTHGRACFPCNHPLFDRELPFWSPDVRQRLADVDVLFAAGLELFAEYMYHEPAQAIPDTVSLIHLDPNPWQVGKNYPCEVGLIGDIRTGLSELVQIVDELLSPAQRANAKQRTEQQALRHRNERESLLADAARQRDARPMTMLTLMDSVGKALSPDCAIVEEAPNGNQRYFERLGHLADPSGYFGHRGWALGWGLGCSLGVKLAWPDRPVVAVLGDGAAVYGIQGLWSAARYGIPVTFVVCNNHEYQILKTLAHNIELSAATSHQFVGMDLTEPKVDFLKLADSFGVEAKRLSEPQDVTDCVRDSFVSGRPVLIDVPTERFPAI